MATAISFLFPSHVSGLRALKVNAFLLRKSLHRTSGWLYWKQSSRTANPRCSSRWELRDSWEGTRVRLHATIKMERHLFDLSICPLLCDVLSDTHLSNVHISHAETLAMNARHLASNPRENFLVMSLSSLLDKPSVHEADSQRYPRVKLYDDFIAKATNNNNNSLKKIKNGLQLDWIISPSFSWVYKKQTRVIVCAEVVERERTHSTVNLVDPWVASEMNWRVSKRKHQNESLQSVEHSIQRLFILEQKKKEEACNENIISFILQSLFLLKASFFFLQGHKTKKRIDKRQTPILNSMETRSTYIEIVLIKDRFLLPCFYSHRFRRIEPSQPFLVSLRASCSTSATEEDQHQDEWLFERVENSVTKLVAVEWF